MVTLKNNFKCGNSEKAHVVFAAIEFALGYLLWWLRFMECCQYYWALNIKPYAFQTLLFNPQHTPGKWVLSPFYRWKLPLMECLSVDRLFCIASFLTFNNFSGWGKDWVSWVRDSLQPDFTHSVRFSLYFDHVPVYEVPITFLIGEAVSWAVV